MWRLKINYLMLGETYQIGQPWLKRGTVDKIVVLYNLKHDRQLVLVHWDGKTDF